MADLELWPSDRGFRLRARETPSMLFRFHDGEDGWLGARATSAGDDFTPGHSYEAVELHFWADEVARTIVRAGSRFVVWYGGDVGEGVIRSCDGV